jgi:hypothetical protein
MGYFDDRIVGVLDFLLMAERVQNLLEKFQVLVCEKFQSDFLQGNDLGYCWILLNKFLGLVFLKVFVREKQSGCYDFDENFGLLE